MRSEVIAAKVTAPIALEKIPDGTYQGLWGGYIVNFKVGQINFELTTSLGLKGMNFPCIVTVRKGTVTVDAK